MQGKQYHQLRIQFLTAINSAITAQNDKKSGLAADQEAATELTDYLSLNAETPVTQIHAKISSIVTSTTHKVTTNTGFMSSKEEIKPTAFAETLQAALRKFNLPNFLAALEKDYEQLLAQNSSSSVDRKMVEEIHALKLELEAKKTEVKNLRLNVETLEEKNEALEGSVTSLNKRIKTLEQTISDADSSSVECHHQLENLQQRLKETHLQMHAVEVERKKLSEEHTELTIKSKVASAQLEALHSLKDNFAEEAKRRLEELERVKKDSDARIQQLLIQINEKEEILQKNHRFINEELQETFTRLNESMNTSQIMRQNQSMLNATSNKAVQPSAKQLGQQREKMSADPKTRQKVIDDERLFILEPKRQYLTNERLQAIFIIAQQFPKFDSTRSAERAFCVECIKLLAPTKPASYGTTADCVEAIKKMASDHNLNENDTVVHFIRSLSSIKADAPQKQLDDASQVKLIDSLHRMFSTIGYNVAELGQYYPKVVKAATAATAPLHTLENKVM